MSTVQEALEARKKRKQGRINAALEESRERRYKRAQEGATTLRDRINAEIESAKKVSNTWGANAVTDAVANTQENVARVKALKRELNSYKGYLKDDSYNSLIKALDDLGGAYDTYLKNAEIRANFADEKAYNEWYEDYKVRLSEEAKMQKEDISALQGELDALSNERDELRKSSNDENEKWYETVGRWLGGGATDTSLPTVGVSPSQTVGVDERILALNDLISQKQDYIQKVEKSQTAANYAALAFKDDFDEKSAYKSTRYGDPVGSAWQSGAYTDTGYGDIKYDYINGDPNARSIKDAEAAVYGSTFAGADESFYKQMTPEEVSIFNYIYKTESPEAAYAYVDFLRSDLNARQRKTEEERWAKEAEESPFLTSIFSSIISPLKTATFVGQVGDYLDDGSVDQNAGYNRFSYINSAIRNEVSGNIDSGVGKFAYQTGMSMADSLMSVGLSGGNSTVSSVIMGTGAAADTIIMAKDRGLSDDQALGLGVIAGAAEMLTEKMSIDALLDATGLEKSVVGYIIKNALTEAGEEFTSSTVNLFADILISKDKSEWQMSIDQYKKDNPEASDGEAFWHAVRDQALAIGLDTLGGLVSGGVMGGGGAAIGTAVNTIKQNAAYRQHGRELIEQGAVDPLRQLATEWVAQNPGDKTSLDISSLVNGSRTEKNIGKLSATLEGAIAKQNKAEVENALVDKGIPKRDAKKIADYLTGESTSISDKLKDAIDNSENIKSIVKDIIENPDSSANERRRRLLGARLGMDVSGGKNLNNVLNPDTESDIIKESEEISDESTDGIHLRDSGERNDGQNTEESVFDLESSTGTYKSGGKAEVFADSEAARLVNEGREVSVASLGVLRGSDKHTVRLLDEGNETPTMKQALARASERGLNLKFFVGGNLVIADADGKLFAARGYILGNTMLVRADHPYYTSDQITRHEIGHDMIAKGEVNIKDVQDRLKKTVGKENVESIADQYATAYEGTNMSPDEIWEECICDSLGDMNIFAGDEIVSKFMAPAMSEVKSATENTAKSPTQTRGSPGVSGEGKASYQFWYPNLTQREWNLLNRTLNKELTTTDNFIDKATKWLYADEKGVRVFAIYGIGDGTEATVLYAVGGIKAQNLNRRRIDYESGKDRTKRNSFKRNLDRIRVEQNKYGNSSNRDRQDVNETTQGVGTISLGSQRGDNGGRVSGDSAQVKFSSPEEAKGSGEVSDAKFSIEFADDIANKQRKYAEDGLSRISSKELEKAIADTAHMVKEMKPYANILPQDKVGKTLVKNGSYDVSVENTTVCIRTLAYNSFVDMVSEKVGRPLTQMESFLVSQKLYEIAKEPQCLYCYVSLDRKAFNEMVIRYVEQRDEAIKAYEAAGKPKIPSEMDKEWSLFKDFLDGRKPTTNMWDRYVGWLKAYNKGEKLVSLADISTEAKRLELVESGGEVASQVKDILKYAQSASWAKKQTQYVAYYDEILKLKPSVIRNLNNHYGMRWYSFSDYSGAFIVENMQQITDAAIRGLKGLSYTKDTDFAEIFAPTGMNINISVYATKTANGYEIDAKQSANIDEAIKLREKYPNVGIVVVATDKGGVEWALAQEWSDVVIPFHTVRTGADVAEFYNWEIFNAEQSDTVADQNLWDAYVNEVGKKKASKNVYPSEHQNNKETYLSVCEKRGLTPRFKSFLDNPNYMKLVNETRQSEGETSPLKAKFDVNAAERSFDKFVEKGGYYEGWYNDGIDVDGEADIVAEDVRAGRKANEVSYGRQDVNFEDVAKGRKTNRQHGKASRELDFIDYLNEEADEELAKAHSKAEASMINRLHLINALESITEYPSEKETLKSYRAMVEIIADSEKRIATIDSDIKSLSKNAEANVQAINKLKSEKNTLESRIHKADERLLSLESTKALKRVLERERAKAYRSAKQEGYDALKAQIARSDAKLEALKDYYRGKLDENRIKANEKFDATVKRYQESRKKGVEGRRKTEMRHKINKVAHELDALLNRGTKERNVKKGQSALVRSALDLSDMLFATDDELLLAGIVTEVSDKEMLAMEQYKALYDEYHSYDESVTENKEKRKELRSQMNEVKKGFAEALERERKRISKAKAGDIFDALINEYDALKDSKDKYIALAYKPEVKEHLSSLKSNIGEDTTIKEMSLGQLEDLYKAFSMIKKMVSESGNLFRHGKTESLADRLDSIYGEMNKVTTLRDKVDVDLPDIVNAPIEWANKFSWNNLRPVDAFDRIGSRAFEDLYWDIIKSQSTYASDISEVATALEDARKKYGFKDWKTKDVIGTFKTAEGQTFTLTLREAMSIYAYSKRDQADAHLREGGFQFEKDAVYKKKGFLVRRKNTADTYRVGDGLRAEIISKLTKAQKAYVDEMQTLLTAWGEKGNEQSRLLYGIDLFTEAVYFPLFSSKDYISSVQNEIGSTVTSASILSQGMTKATKPGANNPIILRGFDDVILEHFDKMSKYHAYAVTIDNMRKVIDSNNNQGVAFRSILREKYGVGAEQYLENYLKDLNGSATISGAKNPIESFFGKSKGVAVSANISVWSQQYFSIIRAAAEVNPKYFIPFLGEKFKNPDLKLYEEMKKYAPITVIKEMGGFDVGANSSLADYIGQDNAALSKEKAGKAFQDALGIGAIAMDKLGWITIWSAVKKEIAATGKYSIGSTAYLRACGERFEEVIVRTQVYDSVNARSGFMRSKNGAVKYLTSFMGEPTVIVGMASTSLIKVIRNPKDAKAWGRLASNMAAIALAQAMTTVVKSLVGALRDKDKDEKYWEKYAQALGRNFSDDLNPLNYLPVFRDLVSIWNGYDIERPDISLISDAITAYQKLIDDDATAEEWLNLAMSTASLFGLPLKNIVRDVSGIARTIANSNNGYKSSKAKHFAEGWSGEQGTRYEDLYYSMIEDDEERLEYYKSTYKTKSNYRSAIRSSIGEQYKNGNISRGEANNLLAEYGDYDSNETYWKLKEWDFEIEHGEDAEYSKYDSFYEAVKTGKNLKAVIKEYTDHGVDKETLASQITTEYKPLYKNMSNAERANIKGYLLNAYALLGYDRAKKSKDIDKWLKED